MSAAPPASTVPRPLLRVEGLVLGPGRQCFDEVIHSGEIVGLAGLEGHGQEQFLTTMAGLTRPAAGRVMVDTTAGAIEALVSLPQAARHGVVYLPRDRRSSGIFPALSVLDNFGVPSMGRFARGGILRRGAQRAALADYTSFLSIRYPDMNAPITALSGGNQQKVLLARWLALGPRVMLLNDPTRGVDLQTRMKFYDVFRDLAREKGIALVVLSTEIEEILQLCGRVLVFRDAELFQRIDRAGMTMDRVLAAMFGQTETEQK
jgi:ABC-type sugar transport system ATPase subunit